MFFNECVFSGDGLQVRILTLSMLSMFSTDVSAVYIHVVILCSEKDRVNLRPGATFVAWVSKTANLHISISVPQHR